MSTFAVEFKDGKIGRSRGVKRQEFVARDPAHLVLVLEKFVRKFLMSSGVEVVSYSDGTGAVIVGGFRQVGEFTWQEVGS